MILGDRRPRAIPWRSEFFLPDGTTTDLVSLPIPLFFARTPEETLEFLEAVRPDPSTGQPDLNTLPSPFLAARPWVAHAVGLAEGPAGVGQPLPRLRSICSTHPFRFVNASDEAQYARYHCWEDLRLGIAMVRPWKNSRSNRRPIFLKSSRRVFARRPWFSTWSCHQLAGDGDHTR